MARITLTKEQKNSAAGIELCSILSEIAGDGILTVEELNRLQDWIGQNQNTNIPAIDYLEGTLERILEDGKITPEEHKTLQIAIERVLPKEMREVIESTRLTRELLAQDAQRETKEKNTPIASLDFMVAGVSHENRYEYIEEFVEEGDRVLLTREENNPHDSNAILVLHAPNITAEMKKLKNPEILGYVPRVEAQYFAEYISHDYPQIAYVKKILDQGRYPLPVVVAKVYSEDSEVDGTCRVQTNVTTVSDSSSDYSWVLKAVGILFIIFFLLGLLSL